MIIVRLSINNKGPFNFILDTGVGIMLVTDPKLADSLNVNYKRLLKISGLGNEDDFEAYIAPVIDVNIPGLVSHEIGAAILKNDDLGLSNYAGMPIHGLLGYEFFNNLAVKINFADSSLCVSKPRNMRIPKKAFKLPLTIENRKPYIQAYVTLGSGEPQLSKLVLDLGAGHPLLLENATATGGLSSKVIEANLGVGLTGPIEGVLSRINQIKLGKYKLENVITSFPYYTDNQPGIKRNGNLGMGILKRFSIIIDYPDSVLYLKPREDLKKSFEHDMSGLEYYSSGKNYNHVIISRVEPGSAGEQAGLSKGDEIVAINFKPVSDMTLENIDELFKSKDDRSLLLDVLHEKVHGRIIITLKRRI